MKAFRTFFIISLCFYKISGLCECPIIKDEPCEGEVKIFFSTKADSSQKVVKQNLQNIWDLNFDPWGFSKILLHAHDLNISDPSYTAFIKELVSIEDDTNVFSVDYSYFFNNKPRKKATYIANYVGKCVADFVSKLRNESFPVFPQFHGIGDAFGATILHYSSKHLKEESFEQITAFNPSYGTLIKDTTSEFLAEKDAQFVDIWISTDVYEDILHSTGHVKLFLKESTTKTYLENYVESIHKNQGFYAYKCNSSLEAIEKKCSTSQPYVITGENIDKYLRGIFWVDTSNTIPYFIGDLGEFLPINFMNLISPLSQ